MRTRHVRPASSPSGTIRTTFLPSGARVALAAAALSLLAPVARADAVLDWNAIALRTTAAGPFDPPLETRSLAMVHLSMFEAVNSITREFRPYLASASAPAGASAEAAAAAAAHRVLVRLYPAQQPALDAALAETLAPLPSAASSDGIGVGVAAADRLLAARADDGADEAVRAEFTPRSGPGSWVPTPPAFRPALDPGWGLVTPFLLESADQFRPKPPPPLASARYAADFAEVRELGAAVSTSRTQAQTDLARLWVTTAPQVWNPVARQAAIARGLETTEAARLLALLNLAGADAFIASWNAKFLHEQWRPVTAIRAAEDDGNPDTAADPEWTPLLVTPPFPDYVAGHAVYAGAAARVLADVLGEPPGIFLAVTSPTAPGVQVTYATFEAIADGVVDARVWGGVHWRTSCTEGKRVGEKIGRYAVRRFLRPRGEESACDGTGADEMASDGVIQARRRGPTRCP
jgi:hypothetical protein